MPRVINDGRKVTQKKELYELDFKNDDDIIDFTLFRWDNRESSMGGLYKRWMETIAAYQGFYYHDWDTALRRFETNVRIPKWRVRLAINLLLPRVRKSASSFLRNRPIFDVLPASSDPKDVDIASAGRKALQAIWYQKGFNLEFVELLLWFALTGNAYWYPHWDPNTGPIQEIKPEDFLRQEDLQQAKSQDDVELIIQQAQQDFTKFKRKNDGDNLIFLGDNELDTPSPFDIIYDHGYNFNKIPWLIRGQLRPRSYYEELGIDTSNMMMPSDRDKRYKAFSNRMNHLSSLDSSVNTSSGVVDDDDLLELHLWLPRSPKHKEGFRAFMAGGEVITKGKNPYNHGKIPYVHFVEQKVPGKITGFSSAGQAVPVIKNYLKGKSQLVEMRNTITKPKWLVPYSANLLKGSITSEPGQIVRYQGAIPPSIPTIPSPPAFLGELLASDIRDIDEITAQRDATRGNNPAGSRSGSMLENLQAQDEGALAITGLILDTGFSLAGQMILSNAHQFIEPGRLIQWVGERNSHEVFTFKEDGLKGPNAAMPGADYFNVRVTTFSQFGLTRTGQIQILQQLLQFQVFGQPPEVQRKIFEFLQIGWFQDKVDENASDRAVANRENLIMSQGQPVPVEPQQEHVVHKKSHKEFMNTEQYRQLDPQVQKIFQQHLFQTELMEVTELVKPQILAQVAALQLMKQLGINPNVGNSGSSGTSSRGTSS